MAPCFLCPVPEKKSDIMRGTYNSELHWILQLFSLSEVKAWDSHGEENCMSVCVCVYLYGAFC